MPIYEFHCGKCDKDSEVLVRSADWSRARCPHCGSRKLVKKLSVFAPSPSDSAADPPPCSGNPGSCGRCSLD